MWQFYYKMRHLLQNVIVLLQIATVITKRNIYYHMRRHKVHRRTYNSNIYDGRF